MAYMEKKVPFRSTQFWLNSFRYESKGKYFGSDHADNYFSFVVFHLYLATWSSAYPRYYVLRSF